MLHEDVKTLANRVNDLYNRHDLATLAALHAPDFKFHFSTLPGGVTDKEGWKAMMATFWNAYPDLQNAVQDQFIVGDTVVLQINYRAAHLDELPGLMAVDMRRYENGVVEEEWLEVNEPAVLQELGIDAAAAAAEAAARLEARANPNYARGAFGGPGWGVG